MMTIQRENKLKVYFVKETKKLVLKKIINFINNDMKNLILLLILFFPFCNLSNHPSLTKSWDLKQSWFVSAKQAILLHKQGGQFLDARMKILFFPNPVPAISVDWKDFSNQGKLVSKEEILKKLRLLSVDLNKPILVFGDPILGWGEEGRIVWMLRYLGISHSYIVDGGVRALNQIYNITIEDEKLELPFQININVEDLEINSELVRKNLENKEYIFIDVREEREFLGQTPYGEKRGGHLPKAKWIYYKKFLDSEGFVLEFKAIERLLEEVSISKEKILVTYCTGGVRSAWFASVLRTYGYNARNYSGSMWEWSNMESSLYPLEK